MPNLLLNEWQSGKGDAIACADVRTLRRVGELDAEEFLCR